MDYSQRVNAYDDDPDTPTFRNRRWSKVPLLGSTELGQQSQIPNRRLGLVWMLGLFSLILLSTNIISLLLLVLQSQHHYEAELAKTFVHQLPHSDQASTSPGTILTTFNEAIALSGTDAAAQETWDALMATGGPNDSHNIERGLVWTYYNETQRIPYSVAMWHALHCLNMLHRRLYTSPDNWASFSASFSDFEFKQTGHLPHCFGYLAQHILCAGDTTLEKPVLEWGGEKGDVLMRVGVTGSGTPHQCKDLSEARRIVKNIEGRSHLLPPLQWEPASTLESVYGYLGKG
ncbi:hypothetical protein K469DRAFT_641757 [Zopfia rhizophila CBS 207.26]|uniref:Tat pathway signal sequence n=1 Tax=Zopfia rhizophila CBS 207.26 TaxID=1314779 RepID=A0A6A6DKU8_9PEZI|nr:hypothetical protein K469DRAFT_641757 [Zopfia rhizophila CBS 207.26]